MILGAETQILVTDLTDQFTKSGVESVISCVVLEEEQQVLVNLRH